MKTSPKKQSTQHTPVDIVSTVSPTQPRSYHAGANDERTDWMAKLKREKKTFEGKTFPASYAIDRLLRFGQRRVNRTRNRKGGL